MEKVVVPQFIADWYEENKTSNIYALLGNFSNKFMLLGNFSNEFMAGDQRISEWTNRCEGGNLSKYDNAQEVIVKMHLYGYEVEEEKKYLWRKKKEYMFNFEHQSSFNYLNLDRNISKVFFGDSDELILCRTKFTETEVRELVSEEDFNKLERVEADV